ncbi:MAG: acetate--CoA ligase family protein, partial [Methanotrichaceae archaeon]|nr:acetate--CoA ligase family protein [Methanotrichaceae archaeon]
MRLFEYEAKEIFRKLGIPVPKGATAGSTDEVSLAVRKVGLPVAIKAQVLVGGRGKAGGIKFAESLEDAVEQAKESMSEPIRGHKVNRVLIEEKLNI